VRTAPMCSLYTNITILIVFFQLINNILGNGSNYANAFFEIPYIRTYSPNPVQVGSSTSSAPPDQSSDTGDQNNQQKIGSSPRGFYSSWLLLFLSSLSVAVLL
jgi:hypothetical protein